MPFDPTLPVNSTQVVATELRGQFNGLKELIDAVPVVSDAQVDAVNTVDPGAPAAASVNVGGSTLHFTFDLPRGADGPAVAGTVVDSVTTLDPGSPATVDASFDGTNTHFAFGIPRGDVGSPAAQFIVDGVTTVDPGESATATVSFDGVNAHLSFGIPRGADGLDPGAWQAALDAAVAGTSSNTNAVDTLPFAASAGYDHAQQQAIVDKLNELILAARR